MKQYIMAIDQGTTSSRAILFDESSNIIATAQKEVDTYYPHPGWVEQNANDIWASVVGVMKKSLPVPIFPVSRLPLSELPISARQR